MDDQDRIAPLPARRVARPGARAAGAPACTPQPTGGTEVRSALAADLPAVTDIQAAVLRDGAAGGPCAPPDLRQVTALRERLAVQGYPFLVALRGGTVVGFAHAAPFGGRDAWRGTVEGSLVLRAGEAEAGAPLLSALVEACAARGFRQMIAVLGSDRAADRMAALHRGQGFVPAGVLRGVGPGGADAVLLQRGLAAAERQAA